MSGQPQDDAGLLKAARQGGEQEFLALYHSHRTPLFRFAWRLTGSVSSAEDIIQESFLALLDSAAFDAARGSVRAYLFGVTRNLARARMRLAGRELDECQEEAAAPDDPLGTVLAVERSEAVAQAVAALAPMQREALILFEYEDLSLEEIAQATASEIGAVKARLHRARESLRRKLAPLAANPRSSQ